MAHAPHGRTTLRVVRASCPRGMSARGFTFVDVLAVIVLVVFLLALGVAAKRSAREVATYAKCLSNLKQIGTCFRVYENANHGQYPRAVGSDPAASSAPIPVWGTPYEQHADVGAATRPVSLFKDPPAEHAPLPNDITATMYLLVVATGLPTEVFTCPGTYLTPWDFDGASADRWTNWRGNDGLASHVSYSFQNMFPSRTAIGLGFAWNSARLTSEFALASDMSPGDAALQVKLNDPDAQQLAANSFNHGRQGQNVLFGDGHADWSKTVFVGVNCDNIFTANSPGVDRPGASPVIVASPVDANDSILLPTAQLLGIKPPPMPEPDETSKIIGAVVAGVVIIIVAWILRRMLKRESTPAA
ncbi:MAG: hypothetical protein QM770_14535 [Tepidisphaeraceae bacterium]